MFEGCAHVHADVAWLSFVKFQTCEFEAHCELKIALKKKSVFIIQTVTPGLLSEQEDTFGYL